VTALGSRNLCNGARGAVEVCLLQMDEGQEADTKEQIGSDSSQCRRKRRHVTFRRLRVALDDLMIRGEGGGTGVSYREVEQGEGGLGR